MSPWPATSSTILGIQEGRGRGGYRLPPTSRKLTLIFAFNLQIQNILNNAKTFKMRWEGSSGLPTANWPCLLFAFNPKYCFISEMKEKGPSRNILGKINRRMECSIYLCNIWKIETEHWMNGRFVLDKREVVLGSSHRRYIGQFLIFFWNIWNKTRDQCKLSARDKSWDGALGAGWKNIGQFLQCRLFYDWPLFCGEINSVLSFLKDYKKLLKLKCFLKYEI